MPLDVLGRTRDIKIGLRVINSFIVTWQVDCRNDMPSLNVRVKPKNI